MKGKKKKMKITINSVNTFQIKNQITTDTKNLIEKYMNNTQTPKILYQLN